MAAGRWRALSVAVVIALASPASPTERILSVDTRNKTPATESGRLSARPREVSPGAVAVDGVQEIDVPEAKGSLVFVPFNRNKGPVPLLVMLHGAGGGGADALRLVRKLAETRGVIVLAPNSRARSWDIIVDGGYGSDVRTINAALNWVFERLPIDAERIAIAGFSDGASYALSLGFDNGDLFRYVIGFSPGFMAPVRRVGQPRFFISHGVNDTVLPIEICSRRLVPRIRQGGYELEYIEFPEGHSVPEPIRERAFDWFLH